jgi:Zn finger protein HypA/HybF involved in hydrogenase expression
MVKRRELFEGCPREVLFWCDKCDHVWYADRMIRCCPLCKSKLEPRTKARDAIAKEKYDERYGFS